MRFLWILLCVSFVSIVGCDGLKLPDLKLTKPKDETVIVNPNTPVDPEKPSVPVPKDFNSAAASDELAKQAEWSNDSIAEDASAVLDGMLTIASQRGALPSAYIAKVRAAVPAIGVVPARDLTKPEVDSLRAVR